MINAAAVEKKIRTKYRDLERVADGVYRAIDIYGQRQFAIRYFDLTDQLIRTADHLKKYQEDILSDRYFSGETATDLRWNHYLYFVTSDVESHDKDFQRAKAKIEGDREYARKAVIPEREIETLLNPQQAAIQVMPDDLASTWMMQLEKRGLAYVLDEDLSVPEVARLIANGRQQRAATIVSSSDLTFPEREAAQRFLRSIVIQGFRPCPQQRDHSFGKVNLIVGTNGAGKTSLLEAIEYLYCGQTNRGGEIARKTSLTATFVGTDQKLTTLAETPQKQLRSRHSHWYAKTDLKKLTLSKSFGKFNFLDTDAAVHLSVDVSQEQIGPDIARLLLGSEAEKLSDRLLRAKAKLDEFSKHRKWDLLTAEQLASAARERLSSLRKEPQVSDSIFAEFSVALKQLAWRSFPLSKQGAALIGDDLQSAISATEVFSRANADFYENNEEALKARYVSISDALQFAGQLNERNKAAKLEMARIERGLTAIHARLAALEAVQTYTKSNFLKQIADHRVLKKSIESQASRLSTLGDLSGVQLRLKEIGQQLLNHAVHTTEELLKEQNKRLLETRTSLRAVEDANGKAAVLRQRITNLGKELLRLTPHLDHCPLCHTEFETEHLQQEMFKNFVDPSEAMLGEFQNAARSAEIDVSTNQQRLTDLKLVQSFVDNEQAKTVAEAINMILLEQQILATDHERLAGSFAKLQALRAQGQSEEDFLKQLAAAGFTDFFSSEEVSSKQAECLDELGRELEVRQSLGNSIELLVIERQQIASRFGIDIRKTMEELLMDLKTQLASVDNDIKARHSLDSLMDLQGKTVYWLTVQLRQAKALLQNLTTAITREASNTGTLATERMSIEKLEERITKDKAQLQRLEDAAALLEELIQESSGGELTKKILSENSGEIARTFAKIHMPNEFEIKTINDKLLIIRRSTGKAVGLEEMSTGQRASYALSLFLAMNSRLRGGPPILLFDDPIAHVDDMNVLAFLDHLRDLAIGGSRQIFFATADTKLAGLFRQKFKFLGDESFREIELVRV